MPPRTHLDNHEGNKPMNQEKQKAAYGTVKNKLAEHLQLGTITATNKHIAETLGVSDRAIAYAITKLTSEDKIS